VPVDPGRHWLEAGITGIPRQREWDAVATADAPGSAGDEAEFVALPDGRLLLESGPADFDPAPLGSALERMIAPPYRAVAVRRPELWVAGARSIAVLELADDPGGETVEVVRRDPDVLTIRVDGMSTTHSVPELGRLGSERHRTFVVRARRLDGRVFEVEVEPL
jgi:hypothetical protein